jgi:hypothetical protein
MLHGARAYTTKKLARIHNRNSSLCPRLAFSHPCAGDGISIGHRRITLSTCGVVPLIPNVGQELGVLLAVSLHAANDDLRNEVRPLVPDNHKLRYLVIAVLSVGPHQQAIPFIYSYGGVPPLSQRQTQPHSDFRVRSTLHPPSTSPPLLPHHALQIRNAAECQRQLERRQAAWAVVIG